MTEGIKVLEKYFDMSVCDIVEAAERISAGCEEQIDYKAIKKVCNKIKANKMFSVFYPKEDLQLSYVMEHERIFDYLVSVGSSTVANHEYRCLPHEYLLSLGYTKNVIDIDDSNRKTIEWTHNVYPSLKENFYVWLDKDYKDYDKIIESVSDLCQKIGCPVPERYNMPYYEYCFWKDMYDYEIRKAARNGTEFTGFPENDMNGINVPVRSDIYPENLQFDDMSNEQYSFSRHAFDNYGLFRHSEATTLDDGMILPIFEGENDHLNIRYMKECCELAALYTALMKMEMIWGETIYYRQEFNYDIHEKFMNECITTIHELKGRHE